MSYQLSAGESRRGWIVVGATFVTLGMVYGVWYSYSVFLVAFVLEFGWSRSLVAGVFSAFVIVHGVLGPVNGWLAGRIGPRWIDRRTHLRPHRELSPGFRVGLGDGGLLRQSPLDRGATPAASTAAR